MSVVVLRLGGMSVRTHRRSLVAGAVLGLAALVLLVLSVSQGDDVIPAPDVVRALLGEAGPRTTFVIQELRLPRALTALLVGAALGISGAIFQSITRNPLGSPDVVGFTEGAAAAAVLQILVLGGGALATASGAVLGGLVTALLVYGLAYRGGVQGFRLVLVGIGFSSLLASVTAYLVARANLSAAQGARVWLTGSLDGRGWEHVGPVALALAVLLPLLVLLAAPLRTSELGDDVAAGLGIRVERTRFALVVVGVLLCAVAVASAGPVPFVALAAPQLARKLTRADGPCLAAAGAMGAVLLTAADLAGRTLFGAVELPVGVLTGAIGGVYLIWLLSREWRSA